MLICLEIIANTSVALLHDTKSPCTFTILMQTHALIYHYIVLGALLGCYTSPLDIPVHRITILV